MKLTRMAVFVALAFVTVVNSVNAEGKAPKEALSKKTYPISRLLTSRLNPFTGFFMPRFVGSRGLLGRLKAGKLTGNDQRSIRRILTGKGLSKSEADSQSRQIVEKARSGEFAGGRKYRISRFLTSRSMQGILAGVSTTLNVLSGGLTSALGTGLIAGAGAAVGIHIDRVLGARGLAGRIALNKKLLVSEQRLLSRFESVQQPVQAVEPAPVGGPAVDTKPVEPVAVDTTVTAPTRPSFLKRLFSKLSGPLTPADSITASK